MSRLPAPLRITVGLGLAVAGLLMVVLPGPGVPTLLVALHLLARDVPALRPLAGRARALGARLTLAVGRAAE